MITTFLQEESGLLCCSGAPLLRSDSITLQVRSSVIAPQEYRLIFTTVRVGLKLRKLLLNEFMNMFLELSVVITSSK